MALQLERHLPSGVVTTYHRILRANFNFNPPRAYVDDGVTVLVELEIGEYLDEESRRAGKTPVRTEVLTIPANEATKSILKDIYGFLATPLPPEPPEALPGPSEPIPAPVAYGYEGALPT